MSEAKMFLYLVPEQFKQDYSLSLIPNKDNANIARMINKNKQNNVSI